MGADYLFYVKSIATYAPAFFGYNNSVLARVRSLRKPSEVFWRPQGSPLEVPLETSLMVLIGLYVGIIFAID